MATAAAPIRKKRNFKALQLSVADTPPPPEPEPLKAIRQAPAPTAGLSLAAPPAGGPGGKKRPPPMTLKAPKIPPSNAEQESGLLSVQSSAPLTGGLPSSRRNTYNTLTNTLANLADSDQRFELRNEDLKDLHELGAGNGGSVKKVEHIPTGMHMAKKVRFPYSWSAFGPFCLVSDVECPFGLPLFPRLDRPHRR